MDESFFSENGNDALEIPRQLQPDLVLSDAELADLSVAFVTAACETASEIHPSQYPTDPQSYESQHQIVLQDCAIRWTEARGMANFERPLQHAASISGPTGDFTECQQSADSSKLTHFSIEHAADPIFWIAQDMRIRFVNQAACRHLGYSHEEILGLTLPDIDPLISIEACDAIWSRLRQEKSLAFESVHRTKDGRLIPVEVSGNHIEHEGQEYNCAFVRDVTLRKQAEQRMHRLTRLCAALRRCSQAIVRADSEQELFQEICRISVEHGGMKMAWVGMLDQEGVQVRPVAFYAMSPEYLQDIMRVSIALFLPAEQDPFSMALRENRPVWRQDYDTSNFSMPAKELAVACDWKDLAVLPLHRNGRTVGTFALYAGDADAFDETARNLLIEFASDIDFALDNFDRAVERDNAILALRESEASYSAFFSNNTVVMLLIDPADGSIVNANERAREFYGYETETLKAMNIRDINVSSNNRIQTAIKSALEGKHHFVFEHRMASGALRDVEVFTGPVVLQGRELLLSSIHDITERRKAKQELESSRERLAELSSQLIHAQERERKNLARELHDELGQRFTSLNITLHHLRSQLCCDDPRETWQKVSDDVAALIQRVRDISQSLRPSMLDYLGLGAAVEYLLKEHFFHSSIKYVFEYAGLPHKLPSQIEITAYRIIQEAITNVVRHSKATQVVIELNGGEEAQEMEIIIRDNGTGFNLDEAKQRVSRSGIGLIGMRERVKLLGGDFALKTELGSGTRIDISLPLQ